MTPQIYADQLFNMQQSLERDIRELEAQKTDLAKDKANKLKQARGQLKAAITWIEKL